MPLRRTEGIILKGYPFRETSKIVVLYSPHFGKLRLVAKGARRPKSTFGGSLEPITHVRVLFYHREGKELHTLSQADIVHPFRGLKEDLGLLGYASAACELVLKWTPGEVPSPSLFRALLDALREMERRGKGETLLWWFELKAAEILGYKPELDRCVFCGGPLEEPPLAFSPASGGVLCPCCASGDELPLSMGTARFLARLQTLPASRAATLSAPGRTGEQVREVIRAFLTYHTEEQGLKALGFLHKVGEAQR